MDDVFDNESIWAFKVEYKPSRLTAQIEEVETQQAQGVKSVEAASHEEGGKGAISSSHRDTKV